MRLDNPLTFRYTHANFGAGAILTSLNDIPTDEASLTLEVNAPDGREGEIKLQMQDSGDVVARIHRHEGNPIRVLVVDSSGATLFEG